jgi:hypothetical protein
MKWTEGLVSEVRKVSELIDSDKEMNRDMHAIGKLPEELQKLFSYCMSMNQKYRDLRKEASASDSKAAERDLLSTAHRINARLRIATDIFWAEVKHEFRHHPGIEDESLGLCRGFMVVAGGCTCPSCTAKKQAEGKGE